ncbi:MAG: dienelactone hydrolase family protein [Rhodococcus sp. (in: high G+C Gram-positive bacteria)]|nr:MAG: dienelactone hydrolase family protein [Rhodococcus sp. (in: high G+C Gram-positive bacteria)]
MTSGSMVDLSAADGHTFRAYSVSPEVTEPVGGLVLLHEIFGINSYMRTMAEIFAGHGFHTLVPDLFARQERDVELGYSGDDFTHALELRDNLDRSTVTLDIGVASDFLRGGATSNGRVGTLGYCLGGGLAILAAAHTDVDTAVSYYGVGVQDHLDLAERINVPVLFHVAEHDHYCPPDARAAIAEAFAGHQDVELYRYQGVGHAFATFGRDTFDADATDLAFDRTLLHLKRWLA